MAKIRQGRESIAGIERFGGLNLINSTAQKGCEAARAVNFELTEDGGLNLRPGSRTLISLIPEGFEGDRAVKALWSGRVSGRETVLSAAGGALWELRETSTGWQKGKLRDIDTEERVCIFGFSGKAYILSKNSYLEFTGSRIFEVPGYTPLLYSNLSAEGEGAEREERNMLSNLVRARYNINEGETLFKLPSKNVLSVAYVKDLIKGKTILNYSFSPQNSSVQISEELSLGENALEVCFSEEGSQRELVLSMEDAELFSDGARTVVFLCSSKSNRLIFSSCDENLKARADYFPTHGYADIGEENLPVTGIIRQQSSLLIFKKGSCWELGAERLNLPDGRPLAAYYIRSVNRSFGNAAPFELSLVENHVRSLDASSVLEWLPVPGSREAEHEQRQVSAKIGKLLSGVNLEETKSFYDREKRQYYLMLPDGKLVLQNIQSGDFFCYEGLSVSCFLRLGARLLFGSLDGKLCLLSDELSKDDESPICAEYESLKLSEDYPFLRKNLNAVWLSAEAGSGSELDFTVLGDGGKLSEKKISFTGESSEYGARRQKLRIRGYLKMGFKLKTQSKLKIKALYFRTEGLRLSR